MTSSSPNSSHPRARLRGSRLLAVAAALCGFAFAAAHAQQQPPTTWVDKDTGHRVYRLTPEAQSSGFYFNNNAYTPDGRWMVYTAPDGIHALELATKKTKLVVANPPRPAGGDPGAAFRSGNHAIVVGHRTNSVFYSHMDPKTERNQVFKANIDTGEVTPLAMLPARAGVATVNADETLAAGTYEETDAGAQQAYGRAAQMPTGPDGKPAAAGGLVQPINKGQMMEQRLAARIPLVLFTVNLQTGAVKQLLHSTDWVNHLLFSPADPNLLMYCHEGPWQKVDRIWNIRVDTLENTLIHKRTMLMEIAGHEFWGLDGETIWYDWQYPKGEDFFLAGYNLKTKKRVAYHMQRNEWSIHFNVTEGADLFTGDGGDPGQVAKAKDGEWIELFHPQWITGAGAINQPNFWQPGVFHSEHLVNMSHHNYRLEPNVRFSPDKKLVIFTSNMFGPSYVFGVETDKATGATDVASTPDLARRFNPKEPTPTGAMP